MKARSIRLLLSGIFGLSLMLSGWLLASPNSLSLIMDVLQVSRNPSQLSPSPISNDIRRQLSGGTVSLFGALEEMDGGTFMVSLLIVVGGVLTLESIFHGLHHFTLDTPFNDVVNAIEKELMVVGCTAFIFKIVINATTNLSHDFFFALEFSDLLVPFFSFTNCFLSLILIFMSLRQCEIWRKSYHLKLEELLDEFIREDGNYFYMKLFAPFSQIVSEMEFRVFHDIFCESYRIQRNAFAFDEYVSLVYEKFALHIIEIGLLNWIIFIFLMLLSLSQVGSDKSFGQCDSHDRVCLDNRGIQIFTVLGTALLVLCIFFAFLSRHYEVSIINSRGLRSIEDYPTFLQKMEKVAFTSVESKRLNEEELKRAVREAMFSSHGSHHHGMHLPEWCAEWLRPLYHALPSSIKILPTTARDNADEITSDMLKSAIATSIKRGSTLSKDNANASNKLSRRSFLPEEMDYDILNSVQSLPQSPMDSPENMGRRSGDLAAREPTEKESEEAAADAPPPGSALVAPEPLEIVESPAPGSNVNEANCVADIEDQAREAFNKYVHTEATQHDLHAPKPKLSKRISALGSIVENVFHRHHTNTLADIFWFGAPWLYFEAVKLLPLPLSLYIALWFVHFCAAHADGQYKFLAMIPAVLSIVCLMYTVKCAAILKAIYHVDQDAVLEVLEQTEGSRLLGETIRDKLLSKLDLMGDPYTELRDLFQSIDHDGSNRLSRNEFEHLMHHLDINFSRRKWKQIYHEIDRNYDDEVTFEEFFFFLFPNHDVSLALERKRLKIIRKRVAAKHRRSTAKIQQRKQPYVSAVENA